MGRRTADATTVQKGKQTSSMYDAKSVWKWDTGLMNVPGKGNIFTDLQELQN